jgi:hypothetical protein
MGDNEQTTAAQDAATASAAQAEPLMTDEEALELAEQIAAEKADVLAEQQKLVERQRMLQQNEARAAKAIADARGRKLLAWCTEGLEEHWPDAPNGQRVALRKVPATPQVLNDDGSVAQAMVPAHWTLEPILPPGQIPGRPARVSSNVGSKRAAFASGVSASDLLASGVTRLTREYLGQTLTVDVTPQGFVWDGRLFNSLSPIASLIKGSSESGPRFFRLGAYAASE